MNPTWTEIFNKNKKPKYVHEETYSNILFRIIYEIILAVFNSIIISICLGVFSHNMMSLLFQTKYSMSNNFIDVVLMLSLIYHIIERVNNTYVYNYYGTFFTTLYRFTFDLFLTSLLMTIFVSILEEMATHLIAEQILSLSFIWSIGLRYLYEIVFEL